MNAERECSVDEKVGGHMKEQQGPNVQGPIVHMNVERECSVDKRGGWSQEETSRDALFRVHLYT
jgi:hypothetical protein